MDEKRQLGRRLKELRKQRGISQEKFSEKADVSPQYLSRIESGTENPTLDMLIKLSRALEVEMWEMFDFGHNVTVKELKESLQSFAKTSDEPSLRLASKLIRAVSR
jgi:transcriptional regulator with XRE-family HTH domain